MVTLYEFEHIQLSLNHQLLVTREELRDISLYRCHMTGTCALQTSAVICFGKTYEAEVFIAVGARHVVTCFNVFYSFLAVRAWSDGRTVRNACNCLPVTVDKDVYEFVVVLASWIGTLVSRGNTAFTWMDKVALHVIHVRKREELRDVRFGLGCLEVLRRLNNLSVTSLLGSSPEIPNFWNPNGYNGNLTSLPLLLKPRANH